MTGDGSVFRARLLLFANPWSAASNGLATRQCVRRQKKGVRLWLIAMEKGLWDVWQLSPS